MQLSFCTRNAVVRLPCALILGGLAGCVTTPLPEELPYADLLATAGRCEIAVIGYGGPTQRYFANRTDGTSFFARGTGQDWVAAEEAMVRDVSAAAAACDGEIVFLIS